MEHPWRPRPPNGNICPVCAHSHFPFCPPLPPQHFRTPPPPPDQFFQTPPPPPPDQFFHAPPPPPPPPTPPQQPSYDPSVDHQGGTTINPYASPAPAPAQIPHRPWNANPNFGRDFYVDSNPGLNYDYTGQIGVKRMRFDNVNDSNMGSSEDERRLKLIRDHGATGHGLDRKSGGGYKVANHSFQPSKFGDRNGILGDRFQGGDGGHLREYNLDTKQNYGEPQVPYQHVEKNSESNVVRNQGYRNGVPGADGYNNFKRPRGNLETFDDATHQEQRRKISTDNREFNNQFLQSHTTHHRMEPKSAYYNLSKQSENPGLKAQPPLPTSPPPPLPVEQPRFRFSQSMVSSPASGPGSFFRIAVDSACSFQSPYNMVSEAMASVSSHYTSKVNPNSSGHYPEQIQAAKMASCKTFNGETEGFRSRNHSFDKPKVIDASHILKHPHRANRPDHIVIILRGLPGSGKSYLAKILRDLEVENGGTAPRIHSMDEYFMTEIEKVESEGSRSSGSVRGKKPVMKKVMEYCYEPEMEEAYRSSMLKAFKKTLDEGTFPFVIVDDRNLRVADFAQFWATAKRSGYEVYLLEATYKDPVGCAARNVHGFTQNDIHKMANQWEEAPSLYMKLDIKTLLHGDALEENGIEEVDMDTEDGNHGGDPSGSEDTNIQKVARSSEGDLAIGGHGPLIDEKKGDGAEECPVEVVKELGKSKWSNDLDEDDVSKTEVTRGKSSALSSLVKSYSKKGKSVRWGDQIGRIGFSIGAGKTSNVSVVIGPGSGYNLRSNPLPEEEKPTLRHTGESKRRNLFQEQLQAERESFRAVFDKRKQRIHGLDADEE